MKFQLVRFASVAFCLLLLPSILLANVEGAPPAYAGDPPATMDCTSCHNSFELNSGSGGTALLQVPTTYEGTRAYSGQVLIGHTGATTWGFEMTAVDEEGNQAGVLYLTPTQALYSKVLNTPGLSPDYLTHTEDGSYPNQTFGVWNFDWFSPPGSTGPVTFYFASLAGDGDGTEAGDYVYTSSRTVNPLNASEPAAAYLLIPWPTLSFSLTSIGSSQVDTLTLYSAGNLPFALEGWEILGSDNFVVDGELPDTLHPGEFARLPILFQPIIEGNFQDTLVIQTNIPSQPFVEIHLFGASTSPLAPTAFDLIYPTDGAHVGAGDMTFLWESSQNLDSMDTRASFVFELSLESDFQEVEAYETGHDTTITLSMDDLIDQRLYFWRVYAQDSNTEGTWSTTHHAFITDLTNSAGESETLPDGWRLANTWPNPFNDGVRIDIEVGQQTALDVRVFDLLGRQVADLNNGSLSAGLHHLTWRPSGASGVYLLRVQAEDGQTQVRKLLYVR